MSSNGSKQNIIDQARDFIHKAVQTEDDRERLKQGEMTAFEQAHEQFENVSPRDVATSILHKIETSEHGQAKKDDPEENGSRDNILDKAVEASMVGIETARKVIYSATMPPEEKKIERQADMTIDEKAKMEIQNQVQSTAESIQDTKEVARKTLKSVEEDVENKAEDAAEFTKMKFEENRKIFSNKLAEILPEGQTKFNEKSPDTGDNKVQKAEDLAGEQASSAANVDDDSIQTNGVVHEAISNVGDAAEQLKHATADILDNTKQKAEEIKDGAAHSVGDAVEGTKQNLANAQGAINDIKNDVTQKLSKTVDDAAKNVSEGKDGASQVFGAAIENFQGKTDYETGSETDTSNQDAEYSKFSPQNAGENKNEII